MIDSILRFFSPDAELRVLKRNVSHVLVGYETAKTRVRDARRKFESVREHEISTFEDLKKRTFGKTLSACDALKSFCDQERDEIEHEYAVARIMNDSKRASVDALVHQVNALGTEQHPID